MRARGAWLSHWADGEAEQSRDDHRAAVATLRADIERMGQRLRERDEIPSDSSNPSQTGPVHSVQARRPTRAERHAAIRALLAQGHPDREIARRLGISPTTVGAVRRSAQAG
ncbi:helix-turn-helix domain-containing protein [Methylobacterium sp. E-041]|uniref:helix-turn-helix domain-containing protein n=1 Tax=Methylobacterium sp. E-041 TaxID=2836573 RepID=UPI003919160B